MLVAAKYSLADNLDVISTPEKVDLSTDDIHEHPENFGLTPYVESFITAVKAKMLNDLKEFLTKVECTLKHIFRWCSVEDPSMTCTHCVSNTLITEYKILAPVLGERQPCDIDLIQILQTIVPIRVKVEQRKDPATSEMRKVLSEGPTANFPRRSGSTVRFGFSDVSPDRAPTRPRPPFGSNLRPDRRPSVEERRVGG